MDQNARRSPRSNLQVFLGFLLGVVASLLFLFLAMFLASTLGPRRSWTEFVFEAIAVVLAGGLALRSFRKSSFAVGLTIAFSLALLIDGLWAIGILK